MEIHDVKAENPSTNGAPTGSPPSDNPAVDYSKNLTSFSSARYVLEVCQKLDTNVLTTATALCYFHTFYKTASFRQFDPFTAGCTCIYLASKVIDDDIRIRDIINVGVSCINRDAPPLMLEPYFTLRDSLTQAELLLMRSLGFKLKIDLPHKYILHYMQSLEDWLGKASLESIPVKETAWSILQDSYHDALVIQYPPEVLAATCLHVALELYGVVVPSDVDPWYSVLHDSCTKQTVSDVALKILNLYNEEKSLILHT
ncbi:Cyclin N-terminal [Trinorchestia longiramus]|nr:Cyclin N-terminal [Trinorchestia longiramus]